MSVFIKRGEGPVGQLLQDADRARARGSPERATQLIREAAAELVRENRISEAIDLCATERDYVHGGELAERLRDWKRAAQLYFRGGDFLRAARARYENGEPLIAAELFTRVGDFASAAAVYEAEQDFVRASSLYERTGNKQKAADLLVRALSPDSGGRIVGAEAAEACRRAGVLYAEVGMLDMAVRVLRFGGQNVFAGKLLARAGRQEEAIALLTAVGDFLAAAELARASGHERRALALLGERAEKDGKYVEAAQYFEQAELDARAARLYEFAGEHARAAELYERGGQPETAAEIFVHLGQFVDAARCMRAAGRANDAQMLEEHSGFRDQVIRKHVSAGEYLRAAEVLFSMARTRDRNRLPEVSALLSQIPPGHPDYPRARALLAEVLVEQGDSRGAIGILASMLEGIQLDASHVPALYQYGRLLELEGYLAQARHMYRSALALDPSYRDLADRMRMLGETNVMSFRLTPPRPTTNPTPRRTTSAAGVPVAPLVASGPISPTPMHPPTNGMLAQVPTAPLDSAGLLPLRAPPTPVVPGARTPFVTLPRSASTVPHAPSIPGPGASLLPVSSSGVPATAPLTSAPPTSAPPTSAPPTSVPLTSVPPTSAPPTSAPPTSAPLMSVPAASDSSAPSRSVTPTPTPTAAPSTLGPALPTREGEGDVRAAEPSLPSVPSLDPREEAVSMRPSSLEGLVLRGRFRIERKLGRGAQAEVYLARDLVLARPVAIKVMSDVLARDNAALERFLYEARLAARVHHASCISIFDFGQERGITFMAMEYFKGVTLRDRLAQGRLHPIQALTIARDIASALGAVHAAGIVHRDVKPTNVMVDEAGNSRIADFGVAKDTAEETVSGVMVGTMKYMAPEQARGRTVDARSDVFSLGAVLFEMLAGRAPFGGTLDALIRRVREPPPELPEELGLPEEVRAIVTRCLQKKREARYPSVEPLIADLTTAIEKLKVTMPMPPPVEGPKPAAQSSIGE